MQTYWFVDFIRYHKAVIFYGKLSDPGQLFSCKDLSTRVRWIADNDCFCTCLEAFFRQINIKLVGRRHQRNVDRLGAGQDSIGSVVFIKRGEYHDLVARIADRHHGAHHGLCSAAGYNDLGIRIDGSSDGFSLLSCKSLAEIFCSECNGILVRSFVGCFCQCIHHFFRRIEIRSTGTIFRRGSIPTKKQ